VLGGGVVRQRREAGQRRGRPGHHDRAAAKHGLVGLARTLALELAPQRIRVNTVHPTNVRTPMLDNELVLGAFRPDLEQPTLDDARDALAVPNLLPTPWVEARDIANALLWLVSDEARYVSGVALPVDAGFLQK
jgi:NAD(P)-dependent dehydrogenase (short-subunit alcohol dehydrogenase family)